jgi:hypothetical protein
MVPSHEKAAKFLFDTHDWTNENTSFS